MKKVFLILTILLAVQLFNVSYSKMKAVAHQVTLQDDCCGSDDGDMPDWPDNPQPRKK